MFTGIIKNLATVKQVVFSEPLAQLTIKTNANLDDISLGDSIAINGVCLTVTQIDHSELNFDLGVETLEKTTLSSLKLGQQVHLEKAMRLSDRLGGHLVQGHVDGVGTVASLQNMGESLLIKITCHADILKYCVSKGSICLDGVSLTINQLDKTGFEVGLVPHTLEKTCLGHYKPGDRVNLENDLIGKYIHQLMEKQ